MSFGVIEKHKPISAGWVVQKRESIKLDWSTVSPVLPNEGIAELVLECISVNEWENAVEPWIAFPRYRLLEQINFPVQV